MNELETQTKFDKVAEVITKAPAQALESGVESAEVALQGVLKQTRVKGVKRLWHTLGPGLTSGASDDDPSGIAIYSQTGAVYGLQFIWLSLLTFPLMAVVQELCARIGVVTNQGLVANLRTKNHHLLLFILALGLFFANTFNIGADIAMMSQATQLLFPQLTFGIAVVGFGLLSLFLQIFVSYERYARYLKYLAFVLLLYILTALVIPGINWTEVLHYLIRPHFPNTAEGWFLVNAILGTTLSPYLFFWQTSQEVEQQVSRVGRPLGVGHEVTQRVLGRMRIDVWSGMFFSNAVMFFIILTAASTLHVSGISVDTAADAALALRPLAGPAAYFMFTIGIIGTALLAIPVLAASAAYAMAETFGWDGGLRKKLGQAQSFYGVIILSMGIGMLLAIFGWSPVQMLIGSGFINAVLAPIAIVAVIRIARSKKLMGSRRAGWVTTSFAGFSVVLMIGSLLMWLALRYV